MQKAHQAVGKNSFNRDNIPTAPSERVMQLACLTLLPFIVYVMVLFTTMFWFYPAPTSVLTTVSIVLCGCAMQFLTVEECTRSQLGKWKKWIGGFGGLACLAGLIVGLLIHYQWMLFFHKYSNMMKYTNVAASQPALQFEDAGSLVFTEGTTIDRTRSVGYRDIRSSSTLCVAPVVDGQMGASDPIMFFAVGVNCCGWRASFHCDDAAVPGTRGGLLLLEPNQLVSPAMEFMVDEHFDFKAFENAIELQKSVFAVSAAKDYRFLKWVKDPTERIDAYRKRGVEAGIISCGAYLAAAVLFIVQDFVQEARREAKLAKDFLASGDQP